MESIKVKDLVDLFLRATAEEKAPRTVETYAEALAPFVRTVGDMQARDVRPYHLLKYRRTWHAIHSVQRLYHWARDEQGIITENPMAGLRRPRIRDRKPTLERHHVVRLLRAARPDLRRYLLALRETAARPQEINFARWDQLRSRSSCTDLGAHLVAGDVYLCQEEFKGRARSGAPHRRRIIPVSPRLGRSLVRLGVPLSRRGLIFQTATGRAWDRQKLRLRFRRLIERAGLPRVIGGERICCYLLRHYRATQLAAEGMQANVLKELLGHSDIGMTQRYIHLSEKQLLDAWQAHQAKKRR